MTVDTYSGGFLSTHEDKGDAMSTPRTSFTSESDWNREWSGWLEQAGALVVPIVGGAMQRPGLPDRYVAHCRFAGWVEGKRDARQLTDAQRIVMRDLARRGVPA